MKLFVLCFLLVIFIVPCFAGDDVRYREQADGSFLRCEGKGKEKICKIITLATKNKEEESLKDNNFQYVETPVHTVYKCLGVGTKYLKCVPAEPGATGRPMNEVLYKKPSQEIVYYDDTKPKEAGNKDRPVDVAKRVIESKKSNYSKKENTEAIEVKKSNYPVVNSCGYALSCGINYSLVLDLKNADIVAVFKLLSQESGCNIVVDSDVRGTTTFQVKDALWYQVMEIILKTNYPALACEARGNAIRIALRTTLDVERSPQYSKVDKEEEKENERKLREFWYTVKVDIEQSQSKIKIPAGLKTTELIKIVEPAVVTVYAGTNMGTGFLISPNGLLITNYHVVGDALRKGYNVFQIRLAGDRVTKAIYLKGSDIMDLALLGINERR
ncbi:MAG: serine protease [Nitrospirae bacterium YQR-1]